MDCLHEIPAGHGQPAVSCGNFLSFDTEYRSLANALSVDTSDKRETVKESEKKSDDDDDNENKTKNENIPHIYAIRNRKE